MHDGNWDRMKNLCHWSTMVSVKRGDWRQLNHIANVACGFHAGDHSTMLRTVRSALKHGVKIGAHPGLDDIKGFGRRRFEIGEDEVYSLAL